MPTAHKGQAQTTQLHNKACYIFFVTEFHPVQSHISLCCDSERTFIPQNEALTQNLLKSLLLRLAVPKSNNGPNTILKLNALLGDLFGGGKQTGRKQCRHDSVKYLNYFDF